MYVMVAVCLSESDRQKRRNAGISNTTDCVLHYTRQYFNQKTSDWIIEVSVLFSMTDMT